MLTQGSLRVEYAQQSLAFDPAMDIINSNGIIGQGFADDCAALLGGTDVNDLTTRMNETLNKLVTWGATCGLHFNSSKQVVLHFKNNFKRTYRTYTYRTYRTYYSDEWIPVIPSKHTRYLGVEIDDELNWDYHITTKIDKCRNLLAILSANVPHTFGPKPKLVK